MSSVGFSGGGITTAIPPRRSYHCYECNRNVAIMADNVLVCPNCGGDVLEELDSTTTSPPLKTAATSTTPYDHFLSAATSSDDDIEPSFYLLPPPPPLPPFLTADDAEFFNSDFSDALPPPPPPPPPPLMSNRRTVAPHPRPPLQLCDRRTTAMLSGLEIDFSEPLDSSSTNLAPRPPPPPPLAADFDDAVVVSNRRIHNLPPPPPSPTPPIHTFHLLPPPPPTTPSTSLNSATSGEIQLPYTPPRPRPRPPPPLPPLPSCWEFLDPLLDPGNSASSSHDPVPGEDPDDLDLFWFPDATGRALQVVEDKFIFDRKMTKEMMSSEDSSRCAVCLDDLELNQVVIRMPCKHIYHSRCILPWLESRPTCPVCRYKLP